MEIRFETSGTGAEADLRSLYRWLADDRSLRGEAVVEKETDGSDTWMAPDVETIVAVVSTAATLSQLPLSYLSWRQGRRPKAEVRITVVAADEAEARALLRRLEGGDRTGHGAGDEETAR
jgi:hypothetical protein